MRPIDSVSRLEDDTHDNNNNNNNNNANNDTTNGANNNNQTAQGSSSSRSAPAKPPVFFDKLVLHPLDLRVSWFPDESLQSMRLGMVKYATTFPGGLYNTSFVFMMNKAKYDGLKPEERAAIDKVSGEYAARLFAAGWDRTDAASRDIQKTTGVQRQMANEAFVNEVKAKQAQLEDKWVAAAEARGLKNARAVLAEFRAETQKLK